jgi:hypothetical protein
MSDTEIDELEAKLKAAKARRAEQKDSKSTPKHKFNLAEQKEHWHKLVDELRLRASNVPHIDSLTNGGKGDETVVDFYKRIRGELSNKTTETGKTLNMNGKGWLDYNLHYLPHLSKDSSLKSQIEPIGLMIGICDDVMEKHTGGGITEEAKAEKVPSCNNPQDHQVVTLPDQVVDGLPDGTRFPFTRARVREIEKLVRSIQPGICPDAKFMISALGVDMKGSLHAYGHGTGDVNVTHESATDVQPYSKLTKNAAVYDGEFQSLLQYVNHPLVDGDENEIKHESLLHIHHDYGKINWSEIHKQLFVNKRSSEYVLCNLPNGVTITFKNSWDLMLTTYFIPLVLAGAVQVFDDESKDYINVLGADGKADPAALEALAQRAQSIDTRQTTRDQAIEQNKTDKKELEEKQQVLKDTAALEDGVWQAVKVEADELKERIRANTRLISKNAKDTSSSDLRIDYLILHQFVLACKHAFDLTGLQTLDNTEIVVEKKNRMTAPVPRIQGAEYGINCEIELTAICQCKKVLPNDIKVSGTSRLYKTPEKKNRGKKNKNPKRKQKNGVKCRYCPKMYKNCTEHNKALRRKSNYTPPSGPPQNKRRVRRPLFPK